LNVSLLLQKEAGQKQEERRKMDFPGIKATDIYLPNDEINSEKWAVIACDQFTSEPEYWERVEKYVGDEPSTLKLIFPEAFLKDESKKNHETEIFENMARYLEDGTIKKAVEDGFVLVERSTESGKRLGLVAALDLEDYDYKDETLPVRATEGTVSERLPAREKIREKAILELPHVMVLLNDKKDSVLGTLIEKAKSGSNRLLYDFDLMEDGGHLRGFAIESDEDKKSLSDALLKLQNESNGLMYAIGDGNHSLAAAKNCYEKLKKTLSKAELINHPMRYALCEIVNLHSKALIFEPIHRVLFNCKKANFMEEFKSYVKDRGLSLCEGDDIVFTYNGESESYGISCDKGVLPVALIQDFCDMYLSSHRDSKIDYIHGSEVVSELSKKEDTLGILLKAIPKDNFFDAIRTNGHFPRKTFSMGEAREKRYYMECRKIQ